MISHHDYNSPDPYLRPVFPFVDKLRRYCWAITWLFLCRWTPNPMHNWRVWILRRFGARLGEKNFIF